jgi:large subunit ribosomal protein L22
MVNYICLYSLQKIWLAISSANSLQPEHLRVTLEIGKQKGDDIMTQVKAVLRGARISPQKLRIVANLVRNKEIEEAAIILRLSQKKGARILKKVLDSAIANAEHNHGMDLSSLQLGAIQVDEARVMKRWQARGRGRSTRIIKRSSHITVMVHEKS